VLENICGKWIIQCDNCYRLKRNGKGEAETFDKFLLANEWAEVCGWNVLGGKGYCENCKDAFLKALKKERVESKKAEGYATYN